MAQARWVLRDSVIEALPQTHALINLADSMGHDDGFWWSERRDIGSNFCFWPSIGGVEADRQRGALVSSDVWRLNKL
jgi:hypothetical protein